MKRLLILLLLSNFFATAQIYDPVKWTSQTIRINETEAELVVDFTIEEGWHIYSAYLPESSPAISTALALKKSGAFKPIGKLREPEPVVEYDPNYEDTLMFHEKEVRIRQRIKVLSEKDFKVKTELIYMVCNESMCLPPEYTEVEFNVKGAPKKEFSTGTEETQGGEQNKDKLAANRNASDIVPGYEPESLEIDYTDTSLTPDRDTAETIATNGFDFTGKDDDKPRSLGGIFFLSLLAGFAALLTPCVFPMIPMTVSFFTKTSKTRAKGIRNSVFYGLSVILIYVLLSVPFHLFTSISPSILNEVSTNVYLNLFFFVVFVVFAISFFGAFEITLPNSWINKADRTSDVGGFVGIFFMALTLVLVSFSCTGPLLGGLLGSVLSTNGGATALTTGMAGFGVGLALPFGLFAAFPSWLNSIPKSGGWLNSVKVVLGFLELALAFKFLSNADLVVQTGLLQREVFLTIWIAIFASLTLYLFGAFRLPHDSPVEKIPVFRLLVGIFSLMFTIYLIPGIWGAPLKLISGFPPPMFYSESPQGIGGGGSPIISDNGIPEGADPEHCPHSLNCFHDFETGRAYARQVNKPIMLDFTGWACVNCRKMEEKVWSDPRVLEVLRNDVVLISLYVDDRTKLPESEQYVSEVTGDKVKTIGNKWSEFQAKNFQSNSQPQYIMLGHNSLEPLIRHASYDPDIEYFLQWLEAGITAFEQQKN